MIAAYAEFPRELRPPLVSIDFVGTESSIKFRLLFVGNRQRLLVGGNTIPSIFAELYAFINWKLS